MLRQCRKDSFLSTAGNSRRIPAFIVLLLLFSLTTNAADLYWIGGSGRWSDINHWSLSSGNSGGQLAVSIPQSGDHVFFDANSGFLANKVNVEIDQQSSCRNITVKDISNAPTFEGNILNIYGSADFQTGTTLNNMLYFRYSNAEALNFNSGVTGSASFYFMGTGKLQIKGILNSIGKIYFLQGSLEFGSSRITTGFFDETGCCGTVPINPIEPRSLDLGTSTITLISRNSQSRSQAPSWAYTGTILNSGSSCIDIAAGADDGYGVSFIGKNEQVYHELRFSNTANPISSSTYNWYQIASGRCTFNSVSFASSGWIASSCIIGTLNLAKSKTYYMTGEQQIGMIINPTADCEALWRLAGYGSAGATIRSKVPITLQNARINSIKAIGVSPFSVNNGIDEGQNSGFIFNINQKDLYWIGGGGNWNDPQHWTTNADGAPSGGCLPTRNDNVFFNRFSGLISAISPVIVNSADAECKSIFWNGVPGEPVFKSATTGDKLSIFGSSTWQKGMSYQLAVTNYESSARRNTLTSNGVRIEGDTHFLSDGEWILQDAFSSPENDLFLRNGHFNTNSQNLSVRDFGSTAAGLGVRTLSLGNSVLTVHRNWSYVNYGGTAIYLNAGESQINLTGQSANFYYHSGLTYHNLTFNNPNGTSSLLATLYSTVIPCTFDTVKFFGNGYINAGGNPTPLFINDLNLSHSKKFLLGTNMEIRIDNLSAGSLCNGLLELGSSAPGTRARLNLVKATTIFNAKVTDVNATGLPLVVTAGIDGGNNQNVSISAITTRNFYWIGGSGNWSDPSHWTLHSDGNSDASANCLPGALDHVFFNQYSGTNYTVTLDIPAHCNNMAWDEVPGSSPVLKGIETNPLHINGSLLLQRGMDVDVERINFVGSHADNTITTNQVALDYNADNTPNKGVFFSNGAGTWILRDALKVKNFGLLAGTFDTKNQSVTSENFVSGNTRQGVPSTLILGSSNLNVAGYWDASAVSFIRAGKSTITMSGKLPSSNSSGAGVNNNGFKSGVGHSYHNLNFINGLVSAQIMGNDAGKGLTFNKVTFEGESSINGSNQFDTLSLGTNKSTHLMAGAVQTVIHLLSNPSCGNWDFHNNGAALKAMLKSAANINLTNVRLSGIAVSGGAEYKATGLDMGNNSGWTFAPPSPKDFYWIGGSGMWNDPAHWTTSADGSPGEGCVPTRFDNVFFNLYSGESPAIAIQGVAEFHNMTWDNVKGLPTLGGSLYCYGSMTLQSSLSHSGRTEFLSSEAENTITTHGAIVTAGFDVYFSGKGSYKLLDDFYTNGRIYFTNGSLNTNGKIVKALSFSGFEPALPESEQISLDLGASKIYLTSSGEAWSYSGTNLNAGTSHIYLTQSANYFKGKDGARYHAITFNGGNNQNHQLYGSLTVDTLIFSSKNSTYQLEAGKTITVNNDLKMSGTNCSTVRLQSTVAGRQASICLRKESAIFNFIAIKDINAICYPFAILPQSTDEGNNSNINFLSNPGTGIGALGADRKVCISQLPIVLDGSTLMPNADTKIQWSNANTGENLGNDITQKVSKGGVYRITMIYGSNCTVTDDIEIIVDSIRMVNDLIAITQPTCDVSSGTLSITQRAGISYSINGSDYSEITRYQLESGTYRLTAKSQIGCISDTLVFVINSQPKSVQTAISYGDSEYQAVGTVQVDLSGQSGGTFSSFPTGLFLDQASGNIDLSRSTSGQIYTVTYSFGSGSCKGTCTTKITILPSPTTISYPLQDYCAVDSVEVIQSGFKNGKYTSSPEGLRINQTTGTVDLAGSKAGIYTVSYTYRDGFLVRTAITSLAVNALPFISVQSDSGYEIYKGQSITLTASGASNYSWVGENIIEGQHSATIIARPAQTTSYRIIACNIYGCCIVREVVITVKKGQRLVPNNVITPNGDGKNDTWIIGNIEQYPNNSIKIFDKAGRMLFSQKNYNNDWNGMVNGKILNEDAYIYVIDTGNEGGVLKGTVTIIRDQQ